MSESATHPYGNYELRCKPHHTDDGRFTAHLVIVHVKGIEHGEHTIDLSDVPSFDTYDEAADHARVLGQAWVDKHGGATQ